MGIWRGTRERAREREGAGASCLARVKIRSSSRGRAHRVVQIGEVEGWGRVGPGGGLGGSGALGACKWGQGTGRPWCREVLPCVGMSLHDERYSLSCAEIKTHDKDLFVVRF